MSLSKALTETYGYEVLSLFDQQANLEGLTHLIKQQLPHEIKPTENDQLLFYFAGHGTALQSEQAQQIYEGLRPEEQEIARRVFLRLVQLGEGAKDTRRRTELQRVVSHRDNLDQVQKVIARFSEPGARLIMLVSGVGTETAEVTHEALFDHWQHLRDWLDGSRDDLRFQRRLDEEARIWQKNGRPEGNLWRFLDLDLLRAYHDSAGDDMTALQVEFFNASVDAEEEQEKAEQERIQMERDLAEAKLKAAEERAQAQKNLAVVIERVAKKENQMQRLLTTVMSVGLVWTSGTSLFAASQVQQAQSQRIEQVAAHAQVLLSNQKFVDTEINAIAATAINQVAAWVQFSNPPQFGSVENSLLDVIRENPGRNQFRDKSAISSVAFNPDSKNMVTLSNVEEVCQDSDIQSYISKLRSDTRIIISELGNVHDSERPLNLVAYQALINCGSSSVPHIFNELRKDFQNEARHYSGTDLIQDIDEYNYPWNHLLYIETDRTSEVYNKAYFSLLSTALIQIGPGAIPSLVSYINNAEKESSFYYYQSLFTLYALGSDANEAVPALTLRLNRLRSGEVQTFEKPRDIIGEEKLIIETLGEIGPASFQDLYSLLQDAVTINDYAFIAEITSALGEIGPAAAPATEILIKVLENKDVDISIRSSAVLALGKIGAAPSRVIPLLIENIQPERLEIIAKDQGNSSSTLELASFTALRMYGNAAKTAIPVLKANLNQLLDYEADTHSIRGNLLQAVITSLGEIGFSDSEDVKEIAYVLMKIVEDAPKLNIPATYISLQQSLPCLAATALGRQGEKVESLMKKGNLLSHEDLPVRILASHIMVNFKPNMLDILIKHLQKYGIDSGEQETALEICFTSAKLAFSSNTLPTLIDLLNEDDESLRTFAAHSIAGVGFSNSNVNLENAVPRLIHLVRTGDDLTQFAAVRTLAFIGRSNHDSTNAFIMSKYNIHKTSSLLSLIYALLEVNDIHPAIVNSVGIGVKRGGNFSQFFDAVSRFFRGR